MLSTARIKGACTQLQKSQDKAEPKIAYGNGWQTEHTRPLNAPYADNLQLCKKVTSSVPLLPE
ncbi:unnamed protein product [Ceratitis capitata]|uniref:(Mediterranean fruit fly) hypothetical protein n=1 Tax=Ceratitis capitata TaxID=7213 RepID=A0A811V3N0_CERCA|nr:unnamed protein product [Ceratitis capitata]